MEPPATPENGRQSRGLARFWPVHGMPVPAQRQSHEDGGEQPDTVAVPGFDGAPRQHSEVHPRTAGVPTDPSGEQYVSERAAPPHLPYERSAQAATAGPAGQPGAEPPTTTPGHPIRPPGQRPDGTDDQRLPAPHAATAERFAAQARPELRPAAPAAEAPDAEGYDLLGRDAHPSGLANGDARMVALGTSRRGAFDQPRTGEQPANNVTALRAWTGNQSGYAVAAGDRSPTGRNGEGGARHGDTPAPTGVSAQSGPPAPAQSGPTASGQPGPPAAGQPGPAASDLGRSDLGSSDLGSSHLGAEDPAAAGPRPVFPGEPAEPPPGPSAPFTVVSPLTNTPLVQAPAPSSRSGAGRPVEQSSFGRFPGGVAPEPAPAATWTSTAPSAPGTYVTRTDDAGWADLAAGTPTPDGSRPVVDTGWAQRSATAATPAPYPRAVDPARTSQAARTENETAGIQIPGAQTAGTQIAGTQIAGTQAAGTQAAGTQAAGTQAAGTQAAGTDPNTRTAMNARTDASPRNDLHNTSELPGGSETSGRSDAADRAEPATGRAEARWSTSSSGSAAVAGTGRRSREEDVVGAAVDLARRSGDAQDGRQASGRRAATPLAGDAPDEAPRRPGDVVQTRITLWDDEATRQFHEEWHELKAQFVDDPVTALTRAHDLLTEAVHELTEALLAERDDLDPLRSTSAPDTESMRMAMRGYREFLDRILAL